MKKNKYIVIIALLVLTMLNRTSAQFTNTAGTNWNTNVGVGVDLMTIGTSVSYPSAFFIDGANLKSGTNGAVFSTNGPSSTTTNWKMSQNSSEKFRIENASGTSDVILGTVGAGRFDIFTNGTGNPRVTVTSAGNVGIAITSPQNLLHVDGGSNASYSQFTNTATGSGSGTTGFQVGVDASGSAILKSNYSSSTAGDMNFYTGNTQRMTILGNSTGKPGYVGIGTTNPTNKLDIKETATNTNCVLRVMATGASGNSNILMVRPTIYDNSLLKYQTYNASGSNYDEWFKNSASIRLCFS